MRELSFEQIKRIVDEARGLGCQAWSISGGEPMLRPDFPAIFEYITSHSVRYTLNTNGTLITPEMADLMKRPGTNMVALYGATEDIGDRITRSPGSFRALLRGLQILKDTGVDFVVQIVPMRDNFHQLEAMISLAKSWSSRWRIGAAWLCLSADGDATRNREILRQRLDEKDVIALDPPDLFYEEGRSDASQAVPDHTRQPVSLLQGCVESSTRFHIDPHGLMSFCQFIRDPALRFDVVSLGFEHCWEVLLPRAVAQIKGGTEYFEGCGSCSRRIDCRWCPAYAYLEHGRFSAPISYLCSVAKENRKYKEKRMIQHRRFFAIGGLTVQVDADLPMNDTTFHPKFRAFEVDRPGGDVIRIRHHFSIPKLDDHQLGEEIYRRPPWAIYRKDGSWIYRGITPRGDGEEDHQVAVFNHDYTSCRIHNGSEREALFRRGAVHSLTLFPTDPFLLAQILADRQGCFLHASGVIRNGEGLLFVGHSGAGKSTMVKMLRDSSEILCDDRMIVRNWSGTWKIHGSWSHGEVPDVSPADAPLRAMFFLNKADRNEFETMAKETIVEGLLGCLVKPFLTADWWFKMVPLIHALADSVPIYRLHFNKTGEIVDVLDEMCRR